MTIAHAISVPGGLTALLIAAASLVIAALVIIVSRVQQRRHIAEPRGVPIWWDTTPAQNLSAPTEPQGGI